MSTSLLAALMLIIGLAAGVLIAIATYAPELRRMARLLERRSSGDTGGGNARITVNGAAPGIEDLAAAINDELERNMDARVAAMRGQQDFQRDLSALSHDIRTPLTGAKGYLQLAMDEADPAVRRRRLDTAIERIDRTSELLDALFSYTKASDPDLALEIGVVDLREVVEQCLLGHYPEFEEHAWEPHVTGAEAPVLVDADRQALARITENLVVNALRHGAGAPTIHMGLACGRDAVLSIANPLNDPGALDAEHLFDRFYRADAARQAGGSGLGLATAAKLARAMDMKLTANIQGNELIIELQATRLD